MAGRCSCLDCHRHCYDDGDGVDDNDDDGVENYEDDGDRYDGDDDGWQV